MNTIKIEFEDGGMRSEVEASAYEIGAAIIHLYSVCLKNLPKERHYQFAEETFQSLMAATKKIHNGK